MLTQIRKERILHTGDNEFSTSEERGNDKNNFKKCYRCHMSGVMCKVSVNRCLESGVRCQLSVIRCSLSGVRCQVSGVRCQVSVISYQVFFVRYQVSGVSCQVSGVRCPVSGVECHMSHVMCCVSHVTCHMSLTPRATAVVTPLANYPPMHSRMNCKDPKIHLFLWANFLLFLAKPARHDTMLL